MELIWYPKCSTCQRAKKYLDANGCAYSLRDIKEERLSSDELRSLIEKSDKPIQSFFNTSGLKYRELNLKDKLKTMTLEEKIELLSSDGMLVKRPILITDKGIVIGFKEENYYNVIK